jgi:hypothetical protein
MKLLELQPSIHASARLSSYRIYSITVTSSILAGTVYYNVCLTHCTPHCQRGQRAISLLSNSVQQNITENVVFPCPGKRRLVLIVWIYCKLRVRDTTTCCYLAPCSDSIFLISSSPASWKAVLPSQVSAATSAPCSSNTRTTSTFPRRAAKCNAVD